MPGGGPKHFNCVLCKKRTKPRERRPVSKNEKKLLLKQFMIETVSQNDTLCNKCRHKFYSKKNPQQYQHETESSDEDYEPTEPKRKTVFSSPPSVTLPLQTTSKSHSYCFVCKKPGPKLVVVSPQARFQAFLHFEIIIPAGSRCCPGHVNAATDSLYEESVSKIKYTSDCTMLNKSTILDLLRKLRKTALQSQESRMNFDTEKSISPADYQNMTGITKSNFDDLHENYVKCYVRNTPTRTSKTSLGIFLFKLKSGISNQILSTIFGISKSSLRRGIAAVRKALMLSFVPQHLGFEHISRDTVIQRHTRPLAQTLLGDGTGTEAIIVLDGTYIYIQKSGNFNFQRRTFSIHKGRPLVKPMVVVTTTGYFLAVLGPYLADSKNNDAAILRHMLNSNVNDIKSWIQENDIFVVDRGFRDALSLLEDLGIKAQMPSFIPKGQKQMSTEEANSSRLVTKVRWVVESANARIKRWRYLACVLPTNQVPNIGDYVSIACSVSNKYLPPLSTGNPEEDELLACKMLHLAKQINNLQKYVEDKHLERRNVKWTQADDMALETFPVLDEEQLMYITCGTYQLKLCSSYIQEHIDGNCDIQVHKDEDCLLRIRMRSRHVSSKSYLMWIKYSPENVESWYCKCRAGARVIGCCSHIASIMWYLGFARYQNMSSFGVKNWTESVSDAAADLGPIDESDSDENDESNLTDHEQ